MGALLTWHQEYEGGRIVATRGRIEVGAVFPGEDGTARWSFWMGRGLVGAATPARSKSVLAAKNALIGAMMDWLRSADLLARPSDTEGR